MTQKNLFPLRFFRRFDMIFLCETNRRTVQERGEGPDGKERIVLANPFAESLRQRRLEKQLSQQQLAQVLCVSRSCVASWETGRRVPDAVLLARISERLDLDLTGLLGAVDASPEPPNVILVDDERIILSGGLPILEEVMPNAVITGFTRPSDALRFAETNRIALAFLDVELGKLSGLELGRDLLERQPRANVIFLTAYGEYSLPAWDTGACGFLLKPLTTEAVRRQLTLLRHPVRGLEGP